MAQMTKLATKLERILLVDDDDDFVLLLKTAFDLSGYHGHIHVVADVPAAIKSFTRGPPAALPQLVLLDLKLSPGSGFDLLRWLRARSEFRLIPVYILTGIQAEADEHLAAELGADKFLVKPLEFSRLLSIAEQVCAEAVEYSLAHQTG